MTNTNQATPSFISIQLNTSKKQTWRAEGEWFVLEIDVAAAVL